MRRLPRLIPAIVLIILYAMIAMSPLASIALRSPVIAHALTGECASDCSICGCSPERSANHTCCCWQKKQLNKPDVDKEEPDCCRKLHRSKSSSATISSRPCGSGKIIATFGVGQNELIPFLFSLDKLVIFEASLYTHIPARRMDWPGEPPDPPPRLFYTVQT